MAIRNKVQVVIEEGAFPGTSLEIFLAVRIDKSLDEMAGTFTIDLTDVWAELGIDYEVYQGDKISIWYNGVKQFTGYVETLQMQLDKERHAVVISGREVTCDLVDCCAVNMQKGFKQIKYIDLVTHLCRPFGIKVIDKTKGKANKKFDVDASPGKTVKTIIDELGANLGIVPYTNANGDLELIVPSEALEGDIYLLQGENVYAARFMDTQKDRYSEYIATSQQPPVKGNVDIRDEMHVKYVANDVEIERYRPHQIVMNKKGDLVETKARAEWEATTRIAKSQTMEIVTTSWEYDDSGSQYTIGQQMEIDIPILRFSDVMLLSGIEKTYSADGSLASLKFVRKDAYTPAAPETKFTGKQTKVGGLLAHKSPFKAINKKSKR